MVTAFSPETIPGDALFALVIAYNKDPNPEKVNMSIGAYRDHNGKPWVLPSVRKAEQIMLDDPNMNHEYLPIAGDRGYLDVAAKLVFGENTDPAHIASVQTVSGTGANHMAAVFLNHFQPFGKKSKKIWCSNPSWANHYSIFEWAGLEVELYPYWDASNRKLDYEGMMSALKSAGEGDTVLLHACAHNPTGVDPTQEQWKEIAKVCKERNLFCFFDSAYQGFASGDLDRDAWSLRYFRDQGIPLLVCQSFSKNMGLYGERAGALHFALPDHTPEKVHAIESQLAKQTRAEISNCPSHGVHIAQTILTKPELYAEWKRDIVTMAQRIIQMRDALKAELIALKTPGSWEHITSQIGMFSYTGLNKAQVARLVNEFSVYLAANGRISIAGITPDNVKYVAKCFDTVVRESKASL